ncbi:MAG: hypothetical protein R3E42_02780 [Burkholderiaceae bacterium]
MAYGANLPGLAEAAPEGGFFSALTDGDGVVRSLPLLAEYGGDYYESLALGVFRVLLGNPTWYRVSQTAVSASDCRHWKAFAW